MKYFYRNAKIDVDKALIYEINSAAERLHKKIDKLDLDSLDISEYNKRYFGSKLNDPISTLQLYTYILALSLDGNKIPLTDYVFVDYGGGSGMLSMLAKELGIGCVIYNDIYDISCRDAKTIATALDITIKDYIHGDIDDLIEQLNKSLITINSIASYDVIEHIYDIKSYLKKLKYLSDGNLRIVLGSGANIHNPRITKQLKKLHMVIEYENRAPVYGHKERDSNKSYFELRKEIIIKYNSGLNQSEVDKLAHLTRGLIKSDIEKRVNEFMREGKILYKPDHPTNTCDPYTGNWAEHLMDTRWLKKIMLDENYNVEILSGYYLSSNKTKYNVIRRILNLLISTTGKVGLKAAPFYVLMATR